jgi:pre-mRNA-splicing factor CWC26
MSSLADYLAKNYLTADPQPVKKSKKRKRKANDDSPSTGLIIADDDAMGWEPSSKSRTDEQRDEMNAAMATTSGRTADFRKKKNSEWKSLADDAAADAILEDAARENEARAREEDNDDAPVVEVDVDDVPKKGGLQSAEDVRREAEKKRRMERKRIEADVAASGGKAQETIYRDASGRRIDVQMKRAEARKKAEEEERKKRQEEDEAKGDVQLAMREQRRKDLEEAKYMTVARSADDVEMNDELKEAQRWNDPAAGFLSTKKNSTGNKSTSSRVESRGPSKPSYLGAFDPNRYGVRPGSRWDGVDRSNGFEKKWFAARNKQRDIKSLEYQWEMDE